MASIKEVKSLPVWDTGKQWGGTQTMNTCSSRSQTVWHSVNCFWYNKQTEVFVGLFSRLGHADGWRVLSASTWQLLAVNNFGLRKEGNYVNKAEKDNSQSQHACLMSTHYQKCHTYIQTTSTRMMHTDYTKPDSTSSPSIQLPPTAQ